MMVLYYSDQLSFSIVGIILDQLICRIVLIFKGKGDIIEALKKGFLAADENMLLGKDRLYL